VAANNDGAQSCNFPVVGRKTAFFAEPVQARETYGDITLRPQRADRPADREGRRGFLDRTTKHCGETGADPDDFVHARLFDDMAPFHFQIEAAWHHSVWGLEAVKTGVFAPPERILKVCTFKMKREYQGEKFGEQLLKKILWFAQGNR
jgi:hypothetical protein